MGALLRSGLRLLTPRLRSSSSTRSLFSADVTIRVNFSGCSPTTACSLQIHSRDSAAGCSPISRTASVGFIHQLAAKVRVLDLDIPDLVHWAGQDISVQDDRVGQLARLE